MTILSGRLWVLYADFLVDDVEEKISLIWYNTNAYYKWSTVCLHISDLFSTCQILYDVGCIFKAPNTGSDLSCSCSHPTSILQIAQLRPGGREDQIWGASLTMHFWSQRFYFESSLACRTPAFLFVFCSHHGFSKAPKFGLKSRFGSKKVKGEKDGCVKDQFLRIKIFKRHWNIVSSKKSQGGPFKSLGLC